MTDKRWEPRNYCQFNEDKDSLLKNDHRERYQDCLDELQEPIFQFQWSTAWRRTPMDLIRRQRREQARPSTYARSYVPGVFLLLMESGHQVFEKNDIERP